MPTKSVGDDPIDEAHTHAYGSPAVLVFPCKGEIPEWHLTHGQLHDWEDLYGARVDVDFECRKAHEWVLSHPRRQKTARGMRKFLSDWLRRASSPRPPRQPRLPAWAR